jgi:hypothetical protein
MSADAKAALEEAKRTDTGRSWLLDREACRRVALAHYDYNRDPSVDQSIDFTDACVEEAKKLVRLALDTGMSLGTAREAFARDWAAGVEAAELAVKAGPP